MMLFIFTKFTMNYLKYLKENRVKLYEDCLKFLKTRIELDLAEFRDFVSLENEFRS